MSPMIIQCANTWCNNYVNKLGDICDECKRRETQVKQSDEKSERTRRWVHRHNKNKRKEEE